MDGEENSVAVLLCAKFRVYSLCDWWDRKRHVHVCENKVTERARTIARARGRVWMSLLHENCTRILASSARGSATRLLIGERPICYAMYKPIQISTSRMTRKCNLLIIVTTTRHTDGLYQGWRGRGWDRYLVNICDECVETTPRNRKTPEFALWRCVSFIGRDQNNARIKSINWFIVGRF